MTITPKPTNVTPDQTERPVARVGRWDSFALSCRKKQAEPADRKSDIDQAQSRSNPGQESPLGSEIFPWILLCRFVHSPIVLKMQAEPDSGSRHLVLHTRRSVRFST